MPPMDRRKRLRGAAAASHELAGTPQARRAVLDKARRKVERALAVGDAADELAQSAEAVLNASDAEKVVLDPLAVGALRAALARYRNVRDAG